MTELERIFLKEDNNCCATGCPYFSVRGFNFRCDRYAIEKLHINDRINLWII